MTKRLKVESPQATKKDQAQLIAWMTGLQMTQKILLKQLELAVVNHEDEGQQLAQSLIGLSEEKQARSSREWANRLGQSMEILQNRDLVNQQLDGVHRILQQLNEFIEQSTRASQNNEPLPKFEPMIKSIYQNYVTAAQRDIHHQITGICDSRENLQKIDLF